MHNYNLLLKLVHKRVEEKEREREVLHMCGIYNIVYRRYFAVRFVSDEKRKQFLEDVKNTALNI